MDELKKIKKIMKKISNIEDLDTDLEKIKKELVEVGCKRIKMTSLRVDLGDEVICFGKQINPQKSGIVHVELQGVRD